MSLSLTVGFAAAILYGPAFAGIVAIGGVVVSDLIISRRHWTRVAFNAGQLALSAGLAALVGGQILETLHTLGQLPIAAEPFDADSFQGGGIGRAAADDILEPHRGP